MAGRRNPLGVALVVLSIAAWGVFGFFLIKTITTATSLTHCTAGDCTATAQTAADYVPWLIGFAFAASLLLTGAILAFKLRGGQSGPTSWDEVARMGAGGVQWDAGGAAASSAWNPGTGGAAPGWGSGAAAPGPTWSPAVTATEFALPQAGPLPSTPDPNAPHASIAAARTVRSVPGGGMVVDLDLDVTAAGQPPRRITRQVTVPLGGLARLYAGATVPVRIDPADPANVTLDLGD